MFCSTASISCLKASNLNPLAYIHPKLNKSTYTSSLEWTTVLPHENSFLGHFFSCLESVMPFTRIDNSEFKFLIICIGQGLSLYRALLKSVCLVTFTYIIWSSENVFKGCLTGTPLKGRWSQGSNAYKPQKTLKIDQMDHWWRKSVLPQKSSV